MAEPPAFRIARLQPGDAAAFQQLRLQALQAHPLVFGATVAEQTALTLQAVATMLAQPDSPAWGVWTTPSHTPAQLLGMVALQRHNATKMVHLAELWGLYVHPGARGHGMADALLHALMGHARTMPGLRQVRLAVASHNHAAIALYQRHGFVRHARYPEQLCVDGVYCDEDGMLCHLLPQPCTLPRLHT